MLSPLAARIEPAGAQAGRAIRPRLEPRAVHAAPDARPAPALGPGLESALSFTIHGILERHPGLASAAQPLRTALAAYQTRLADRVQLLGLMRPLDLRA